jgi:hypothetical protein
VLPHRCINVSKNVFFVTPVFLKRNTSRVPSVQCIFVHVWTDSFSVSTQVEEDLSASSIIHSVKMYRRRNFRYALHRITFM